MMRGVILFLDRMNVDLLAGSKHAAFIGAVVGKADRHAGSNAVGN